MKPKEIIGGRWQTVNGEQGGLDPFKPMGYVDNWVVMRRPSCHPVLARETEFGDNKKYFEI